MPQVGISFSLTNERHIVVRFKGGKKVKRLLILVQSSPDVDIFDLKLVVFQTRVVPCIRLDLSYTMLVERGNIPPLTSSELSQQPLGVHR